VLATGESQKEAIRPDFNRSIMIDFHLSDKNVGWQIFNRLMGGAGARSGRAERAAVRGERR
jgi:hypothetical protein